MNRKTRAIGIVIVLASALISSGIAVAQAAPSKEEILSYHQLFHEAIDSVSATYSIVRSRDISAEEKMDDFPKVCWLKHGQKMQLRYLHVRYADGVEVERKECIRSFDGTNSTVYYPNSKDATLDDHHTSAVNFLLRPSWFATNIQDGVSIVDFLSRQETAIEGIEKQGEENYIHLVGPIAGGAFKAHLYLDPSGYHLKKYTFENMSGKVFRVFEVSDYLNFSYGDIPLLFPKRAWVEYRTRDGEQLSYKEEYTLLALDTGSAASEFDFDLSLPGGTSVWDNALDVGYRVEPVER